MRTLSLLLSASLSQYGGGANAVVQVDAGDWGRAAGALRYVDPAQNRAVRCSLLTFAPAHEVAPEEAAEFLQNQLDMCKRKGLKLTPAPGGVRALALDARALASVEEIVKADKSELLLIVLPMRKTPFYDALKCDTETRLGVLRCGRERERERAEKERKQRESREREKEQRERESRERERERKRKRKRKRKRAR